jgi:hypothetical protein
MRAPDPDGRWWAAFLHGAVIPLVAALAVGFGFLALLGQIALGK